MEVFQDMFEDIADYESIIAILDEAEEISHIFQPNSDVSNNFDVSDSDSDNPDYLNSEEAYCFPVFHIILGFIAVIISI